VSPCVCACVCVYVCVCMLFVCVCVYFWGQFHLCGLARQCACQRLCFLVFSCLRIRWLLVLLAHSSVFHTLSTVVCDTLRTAVC